MLKQLLMVEDSHAPTGSVALIAVEEGKVDEDALPAEGELENVTIELRECPIHKRRILERLIDWKPTSILLLSDSSLDNEEADARTLMLQLQLTDIADDIGTDVPLIIEMNSTRNQQLSQMMCATDFVVSSKITAKMMVQVAEERHKKAILSDLLSDGGSSICMKPVTRYILPDHPSDFYTIGASAARYGEIAIGCKRMLDEGGFEVVINPQSKEALVLGENDELIVLAR